MKSKNKMTHMSVQVKASMIVMGTGQLMYYQWVKGFLSGSMARNTGR